MIPPKNTFVGALAALFSSRKFSRRSFLARRRSALLRAVTARQRFGLASRAASLSIGLLAFATAGHAATQTFLATPVDVNIGNGANYVSGVAPGTNAPSGSTVYNDLALFNVTTTNGFGTTANPITIDTGRVLAGITFDTANVQAFQIGTTAGSVLTLQTNQGTSAIQLTAAVTTAQIIAAPLAVRQPSSTNGAYAFLNNATSTAATLTFSGGVTNTSTRPVVLTIGGTNTGNNVISGVLNFNNSVVATQLTKAGTGTWTLSGANIFAGAAATAVANGIQLNAGTLIAANNAALGTSSAQVSINNSATLQIGGGITLDNSLTLNLYNGGTLTGAGASTANSFVRVGGTAPAAALTATISTTNAADVFTIGNAANDLTGGAADSIVNIAGPGTVVLAQSSNYAGTFSINAGTLRLGNAAALGTAAKVLVFGAGSTGRLQLNGQNLTVAGLNTNATVGTPVVENGVGGTATLTVTNTAASTYGGVLQNGTLGVLALTKSGAGAFTLGGASTYSGATTVSAGTLFANNTTGSATGTSTVGVTAGTLGGSGTIGGAVNVGGRVSPGATGTGSVGNLTVGSLTLSSGSNLDYDITSTAVLDQITVTNSGGLTINGGQLNINGGAAAFTTNGVYNLIGYSGAVGGTGASALTLNGTNADLANKTYTFGLSGSFVTLTIANSSVVVNYYVPDANGAYSNAANWSTGAVPNAVSAFAAFGGSGSTTLTGNRAVTVDGAYTVGTLSFNSGNAFGYTLADGGAGTGLTLNNGGTGSFVTDSAGSHTIAVPLTLTANGATATVTSAADTLTVSGVVSSDNAANLGLTKAGNGTLALTGVNSYVGGTGLNGGTIQINSASSLGDVSGNLVFNGGSLQLLADVVTARNYQVNGSNNAVIDTNGRNLTVSGTVTPVSTATGGLVKNGLGALSLGGINTYTGGTTINAGTVSVAADTGLGAAPGAAATNITIGAGTLQATSTFALNVNRTISLANAASAIDVASGSVLSVSSAITGAGGLTKTGAGQLTLTTPVGGQNNFTGGTNANGGTILLGDLASAGLGGGAITFNGGTISSRYLGNTIPGTQSGDIGNALVVNSGQTGTLILTGRQNLAGNLTGGGTFNLQVDYIRDSLTGNYSGFTGQINLLSNTNGGDFRLNTTTGFGTAKLNMGAGTNLYVILNFNPTATINIGEVSGDANSSLGGGTVSGRFLTYSVGGANTDATYAGVIKDLAGQTGVTKVGTGTWTLSGANTYTQPTVVNGGALNINGSLASASAVTVNTAATLSGTGGTVAGTIAVNSGGTLLAGTGGVAPTFGNLTTGAVTLNAGSTFSAVLGGDASVSQLLASSVSASGLFSVTLTGAATFAGNGEVLTLIPANFAGTFSNATYSAGGYLFTADYTSVAGGFSVDVTAVPEPATWLAGFLLVGAVSYKSRKRLGALFA